MRKKVINQTNNYYLQGEYFKVFYNNFQVIK